MALRAWREASILAARCMTAATAASSGSWRIISSSGSSRWPASAVVAVGLVDKKNCAGSIQATGDAHSALPPRRSARLRGAGRLRESREGVGASPAFSSRQPRTPRRSLAFNPPRRCWREGRPVRPEPRHYQGADVVLLTRGAPVFRLYSARIPLIFPSYSSMNSQVGLAPASVWRIPILYLR